MGLAAPRGEFGPGGYEDECRGEGSQIHVVGLPRESVPRSFVGGRVRAAYSHPDTRPDGDSHSDGNTHSNTRANEYADPYHNAHADSHAVCRPGHSARGAPVPGKLADGE